MYFLIIVINEYIFIHIVRFACSVFAAVIIVNQFNHTNVYILNISKYNCRYS